VVESDFILFEHISITYFNKAKQSNEIKINEVSPTSVLIQFESQVKKNNTNPTFPYRNYDHI
jgi:hypothetical protein